MAKRKQITKRTRFRVFKRDGFTCGYCGRTPPAAILEIDHIEPVASGGTDTPDNLITACFDCNRGKGAEHLSIVPESLKARAARIAESEAQLKAYRKVVDAKRERENEDIQRLSSINVAFFGEEMFTRYGESVRVNFLPRINITDLCYYLGVACERFPDDEQRAFRYFCGICWQVIRSEPGGKK